MTNDFVDIQLERLFLETKIREWAKRYVDIESDQLRSLVINRVKNLIHEYPTQIPATHYHIERYERIKNHYMRGKRYGSGL